MFSTNSGPKPRLGTLSRKIRNGWQSTRQATFITVRLLPGDRFSEIEVAERTGTSRTPVRHALYRLQRERFLEVRPYDAWEVEPLDFEQLDTLYKLRILLEQAAVRRFKALAPERLSAALAPLEARWLVPQRAERQCRRGRRLG